VNFLINSGCRAGTIRNIQNRDVSLPDKRVIYRHTKTGKLQSVPLCSQMAKILSEYMGIRGGAPEDYLFCTVYGEMMSENALSCAIKKYNHRRGVSRTSIHLFRHTFARKFLVDCGGDALILQKLLGHSTLAMTKHYCAIYDTDISDSFDSFSPLAQLTKEKTRIRK
jgi:integrase/recombinase XerD